MRRKPDGNGIPLPFEQEYGGRLADFGGRRFGGWWRCGAFSEDEVVVCRTDTTSIYLERVRPAEKDGEPVSVVFNMSYRLPSGGTILLPYQKNENGSFSDCVSPQSTALDEEGRAYPDAVYLGSSGPERQFMLYVAADVWQAAAGTIRLRLSCNELTYAK